MQTGGFFQEVPVMHLYLRKWTPLIYDNVVRMSILKILSRRNPIDVPKFLRLNINWLDVLSKIWYHNFVHGPRSKNCRPESTQRIISKTRESFNSAEVSHCLLFTDFCSSEPLRGISKHLDSNNISKSWDLAFRNASSPPTSLRVSGPFPSRKIAQRTQ